MESEFALQTILTPEQRAAVFARYRRMRRVMTEGMLSADDVENIRGLYRRAIAEGFDINQVLPSKKAMLEHLFSVGHIVLDEIGLGKVALISLLISPITPLPCIKRAEVELMFGEQVGIICDGMVRVDELYRRGTSVQTENFRKLMFAFAADVRVILLMLADRLDIMRSLKFYPQEEQVRIGNEVKQLYAPLAHRMGLYGMKSELEDLALKFTDRETYLKVAAMLDETKKSRDVYIAQFLKPLKARLDETSMQYEMKGRTKTISSILGKLRKKNMMSLEGIYDLFAIRIIIDCPLKEEKVECWRAYSIVTDLYQPNPVRLKDWISVPKGNGYESLHITVMGPDNRWVEVQIRTKRMDEVAEKGFAAHWKYKGLRSEESMEKWLAGIREVLENPELSGVDFVDDFKLDLYDKEVFAFTPKGEVRRLPKGATVLDFAFDIHTNVGRHCVGAIVNDRNMPMRYVIKNGDQIDILTQNHQEPKADWMQIVVTGKAKAKLRQALKEQVFRRAEIGKELLERRFKNWKFEMNDSILHELTKHFGYKDINIFLSEVGEERIQAALIKDFVAAFYNAEESDHYQISAHNFSQNTSTATEEVKKDGVLMLDRGLTGVDYSMAKCCSPIFGDDVFAFASATGGLKIHRIGCPNEHDMRTKFPYRILEARWRGVEGSLQMVTLRITGADDIGIVTNITQLLQKDLLVKMRSINVNSTVGGFQGDVTVGVSSTAVLNGLIKKVKAIKGVYTVQRIESR